MKDGASERGPRLMRSLVGVHAKKAAFAFLGLTGRHHFKVHSSRWLRCAQLSMDQERRTSWQDS